MKRRRKVDARMVLAIVLGLLASNVIAWGLATGFFRALETGSSLP